MQMLQYQPVVSVRPVSDPERRFQQLLALAKALANELQTLQSESSATHFLEGDRRRDLKKDGIDFYREVERFEIELISSSLDQSEGNQTHAARLLHLKPTTLNAKMKHYGLARFLLIATKSARAVPPTNISAPPTTRP